MKLYVFHACDKWSYCGGLLVIAAENQDSLPETILESDFFKNRDDDNKHRLFLSQKLSIAAGGFNWDKWVLLDEFELADDIPAGIKAWEWNYA